MPRGRESRQKRRFYGNKKAKNVIRKLRPLYLSACEKNDIASIKNIISYIYEDNWLFDGIKIALDKNHLALLKLLLTRYQRDYPTPAYRYDRFYGGYYTVDKDRINMIIEKKNPEIYDVFVETKCMTYEDVILWATTGLDVRSVIYSLNKLPKNFTHYYTLLDTVNSTYKSSILLNKQEELINIAKAITEKGKPYFTDWEANEVFSNACSYGAADLAKIYAEHRRINYDDTLIRLSKSSRFYTYNSTPMTEYMIDVVKYLLPKVSKQVAVDSLTYYVTTHGLPKLVGYYLSQGIPFPSALHVQKHYMESIMNTGINLNLLPSKFTDVIVSERNKYNEKLKAIILASSYIHLDVINCMLEYTQYGIDPSTGYRSAPDYMDELLFM